MRVDLTKHEMNHIIVFSLLYCTHYRMPKTAPSRRRWDRLRGVRENDVRAVSTPQPLIDNAWSRPHSRNSLGILLVSPLVYLRVFEWFSFDMHSRWSAPTFPSHACERPLLIAFVDSTMLRVISHPTTFLPARALSALLVAMRCLHIMLCVPLVTGVWSSVMLRNIRKGTEPSLCPRCFAYIC